MISMRVKAALLFGRVVLNPVTDFRIQVGPAGSAVRTLGPQVEGVFVVWAGALVLEGVPPGVEQAIAALEVATARQSNSWVRFGPRPELMCCELK